MQLNPTNAAIIRRLLGGRNTRPLRGILKKVPPADLAKLFSKLNDLEIKHLVDALLAIDKASLTLKEIPEIHLQEILHSLDRAKILALLNYSPEDHALYFLEVLEEDAQPLLELTEAPRRRRLQQLLSYPEDSAGRDMETNVFVVPIDLTAQQVIDLIRESIASTPFYYIYCVDEERRLVGVASLRMLVTAPAKTPLKEIVKKEIVSVRPQTPSEEVARLVSHYDIIAIPVVSDSHQILGVISVDDVIDIIQDQATADIYASVGLQEGDKVYTPALQSLKTRMPWIFLNLATAIVASSVVSLFEETMTELIVLATLNNIVAGLGGNTAIQALTVVTRGLALGDFEFTTLKRALTKEIFVGLSMGMITGFFAGILVWFWKGSFGVGVVICLAMILNFLIASTVGSLTPVLLKRVGVDPAAGSGVISTAVTDSFGFFSFLGIATLGLHYFGPFS
ncbi:MAG: magnesium transporter [Bdellovibrionales bacterium CG10_big_fil_rev_8_21_14_0_10_45_34]|nr:MAG: magnesium transporter [Bdellovibrionales bacterium CG10_big_fil_rev_8_21_14_0_10_45_34]